MPRPLPWIKLWLDSLHNRKLIRLSLAERGAWWGLLSLAGELGAGGALTAGGQPLTLDEMADSMHISQADRPHLDSMVEKMVRGGSLAWNGNALYVANWEERQRIAPSDRPEAVRERVRLYRERQKSLNNPPLPTPEGEGEGEGEVTRYTTLQIENEGTGAQKLTKEALNRTKEAQKQWQKTLKKLKKAVTRANFMTWLEGTEGLGYDQGGFLVVQVRDWEQAKNLDRSFYSIIARAFLQTTGEVTDCRFAWLEKASQEVSAAPQEAKENYESTAKQDHRERAPARARRH